MLDEIIRPIKESWLVTIKKACDHKMKEFGKDAEEIMRFFEGPHDFMYAASYAREHGGAQAFGIEESHPSPFFRMTFNKPAEVLQLFGPSLYHRNPHRQVNPSRWPQIDPSILGDPNNPMVMMGVQSMLANQQAKAQRSGLTSQLLQAYLNFTPNELDLRKHSRQAIDEAILKGMGVLWPAIFKPKGSQVKMIGSFFETVDNIVFDPDMEDRRHARFVCRRRVLPKREVEEMFGLERNTLRGNSESRTHAAHIESDSYWKARGDSHDLFTYWEVYSRMGFGHHLKDYGDRRVDQIASKHLNGLGSYCFLAVAEDYGWPLNLPEKVCRRASKDEIFERVQWPTPYWADPTDPWPFVSIAFHDRPRKVYPMSHIKPALGEIRFLNWAFSFLADKIKNTSRDFVAVIKSASEDIKTAILSGRDLTLLEFEGSNNKSINEIVQFLQHPDMNKDLWTVIESVMQLLERRLGLNELMYGESTRQMRSAQEAQQKFQSTRIRPDDMAEIVEEAMTLGARKEALAAYWHLEATDVAPIMGQDNAMLWQHVVKGADPQEILMELNYRIEAGSIRKPNRERDMANANQAFQLVGPIGQMVYQMTGDPSVINLLLERWARANDAEPIQIQPPPPQPNPEEQKLQLEQQKAQMDMQMKVADHQLKQQEMAAELAMKREEHQMEMAFDAAEHQQEMAQDREQHMLDILQARQEGAIKVGLAREQGEQKLTQQKQAADQQAAIAKQKAKQAAQRPKSNGKGK